MSGITVRNLHIRFPAPGGIINAVQTVDLEIGNQERVALVGESGCGKTVLAHSFLRLLHSTTRISGEVLFSDINLLTTDEKTIREIRGKQIGMILQNPGLSLDPVLTIADQIAEACIERGGMTPDDAYLYAELLLAKVGVDDPKKVAGCYPHQLSGGMAQRVMIALGIALKPEILIADEPTKALDEQSRAGIISLLTEVSQDRTLFMITHDLKAAKELSTRIVVMYAGEIVEEGSVQDIVEDPKHPYTIGFLNAQPRKGMVPISGISPSLLNLPGGCRFHPRCQQGISRCRSEHPQMIFVNGHGVRCHACH